MDVCYKLQDRAPGKALKLGNGCRKIKHFPGIYCSSWTRWKNEKRENSKLQLSTSSFHSKSEKFESFETFSKFQTNFALHYTLPASHTKILMSMRYVHACHVSRDFSHDQHFFLNPCIGILHFQAKREEKTRNKNLILREKMRLMEIIWPRIRRENNKMGYNFHFVKIKKMRL